MFKLEILITKLIIFNSSEIKLIVLASSLNCCEVIISQTVPVPHEPTTGLSKSIFAELKISSNSSVDFTVRSSVLRTSVKGIFTEPGIQPGFVSEKKNNLNISVSYMK